MAVKADTATAAPGVLLFGVDGFTGGDPQQTIPATQVSATFLNSVCNEINNAIREIGAEFIDSEYSLVFAGPQIGTVVTNRIAFATGSGYGLFSGNPAWYRRTYAAYSFAVQHKWRTWFRNAPLVNVAQSSVQVSGHLVVPDDSVFWATFEVTVVRSDSILFLKTAVLRASCRRTGGSCYVDKVTTVDSFGALGATFDVIATSLAGVPAVAVETTLPASIGHTFNVAVSLQGSNVTIGVGV